MDFDPSKTDWCFSEPPTLLQPLSGLVARSNAFVALLRRLELLERRFHSCDANTTDVGSSSFEHTTLTCSLSKVLRLMNAFRVTTPFQRLGVAFCLRCQLSHRVFLRFRQRPARGQIQR